MSHAVGSGTKPSSLCTYCTYVCVMCVSVCERVRGSAQLCLHIQCGCTVCAVEVLYSIFVWRIAVLFHTVYAYYTLFC